MIHSPSDQSYRYLVMKSIHHSTTYLRLIIALIVQRVASIVAALQPLHVPSLLDTSCMLREDDLVKAGLCRPAEPELRVL